MSTSNSRIDIVTVDGTITTNAGTGEFLSGTITAGTSLSAATGMGAGTAVDLGSAHNYHTMQLTGTSSSATVAMEGSLDNTNWTQIDAGTPLDVTTPRMVHIANKPVRYIRANVTAIVGGNVTAKFMGA